MYCFRPTVLLCLVIFFAPSAGKEKRKKKQSDKNGVISHKREETKNRNREIKCFFFFFCFEWIDYVSYYTTTVQYTTNNSVSRKYCTETILEYIKKSLK